MNTHVERSTRAASRGSKVRHIDPPPGRREALLAAALRLSLRLTFKALMRPPAPVQFQRAVLHALSALMPVARNVDITAGSIDGIAVERIVRRSATPRHALLYLHGGAFCTGSPKSHRSITTQLAKMTGAEVVVPHYRRAPEHPFPAQIQDGVACFRKLISEGYEPSQIAIAGDSAGATLAYMTSMALQLERLPAPAALVMMSPAFGVPPASAARSERAKRDPLVNASWGRQAMAWYAAQPAHPLADPKAQDLSKLPPTLIQVGDDELLYDDALWLSRAAVAAGRPAELEIYMKRWHVFQIHAGSLPGSMAALRRQAQFLSTRWQGQQTSTREATFA